MKRICQPLPAVGLGLLVLTLLALSYLTYRAGREYVRANSRIARALESLEAIDSARSLLKEADAWSREFALTGMQNCLGYYEGARDGIGAELDQIEKLAGSEYDGQLIDHLRERMNHSLAAFDLRIQARTERGRDEALQLAASSGARQSLEEGREALSALGSAEKDRLEQQARTTERAVVWALVSFGVALVLNLLILSRAHLRLGREARSRHQAEEVAESSEARFRHLFESAKIGILVADLQTGEILEANPYLGAILAEPVQGLIGQKIWDMGLFDDEHAFEEARRRLDRGEAHVREHLRLASSGHAPIDIELLCGAHDLGGRQVVQCYVRNLRAQKLAEAERERFFALSRDLLCIATEEGFFRRLNPAWEETLGYTLDDLTSTPFIEFVHPDDHERTISEFSKLLSGGIVAGFENRYSCKGGGHRWLQWSSIFDPEERLIFAMARDVTEAKEAQEEIRLARDAAEIANRELEAFSYSVSHDLRSPLRAIDGFSQALVEDCGGRLDEVGTGYLQRIRAATLRMGQLIDDLLQLSRISRGQLVRSTVDFSALVEGVVRVLREREPERAIEVQVGEGLEAWADPRLVEVAIENLLANAFKFTRRTENARVEVGAEVRDEGTVFFVRDNGAGFDMAYADKLFGAFQRLHSTGEFEGTGIGLATVARIVHRHEGHVWAEAELDRGATFYFTLDGGSASDTRISKAAA